MNGSQENPKYESVQNVNLLTGIDREKKINNFAGVYKITNTVNNKIYIGSSSNLNYRKHTHFTALEKNIHHNSHLQSAYNKYGKKSFIFEILESIKTYNKKLLYILEKHWFDKMVKMYGYKNLYNQRKIMETNLGLKHTAKARLKMRQRWIGRKCKPQTEEHIKNKSLAQKGLKRSLKSRKKMSIAQKNKHKSDKHCKNISKSLKRYNRLKRNKKSKSIMDNIYLN